MKNVGKIFEQSFWKATPNYALLFRVPDPAGAFSGSGSNLRFSRRNPFDFIVWDSKRHVLYALELKTVSGKSISFERCKEEKGEIHYFQIDGLNEWNRYDGIRCGFIIEFRELEKTIFVHISDFNILMNSIHKKSFTINDLDSIGIPYILIPQIKKRTRYTYDIDLFLSSF